jgi:hypothetical protein
VQENSIPQSHFVTAKLQKKGINRMELKIFYLDTAASLSDAELSQRFFSGQYRIIGNLSLWQKANPQRYDAVRKVTKESGTLGSTYNEQLMAKIPSAAKQVDALLLAEAIQKFPREKCRELFVKEANAPGQSSTQLSGAEYALAQLAARFFGFLPETSGTVTFNYETPNDFRAKLAEKEASASAEREKAEGLINGVPPGLQRDGNGFTIVDSQAYASWQERKKAREIIAEAKLDAEKPREALPKDVPNARVGS